MSYEKFPFNPTCDNTHTTRKYPSYKTTKYKYVYYIIFLTYFV